MCITTVIGFPSTAGGIFKSNNCYTEKLVFGVDMVQRLQGSSSEALSKYHGTKLYSAVATTSDLA